MAKITRRSVLALGGSALVGAAVGGVGVAAVLNNRTTGAVEHPRVGPVTVESWRSQRQVPYFIGHRGAGDVAPEHTVPSYQLALDWGAECLEISVVMSSDRVLYCLHDLTLDRTTTMRGRVASYSSAQLDQALVTVPRLGPRWVGPNMPAMPRLETVLQAFGGKAVLCIEPKNDAAYPLLIEMIKTQRLSDSVVIKLDAASPRVAQAKKAGFPVFAYLGNAEVATPAAISALGARLDRSVDCLVLPARDGWKPFPSDLIRRAVDTGARTWVFPVHRRYDVGSFQRLGVEGFVTPDLGYLNGKVPVQTSDQWAGGAISAGELTRDPYSNAYALDWVSDGVIGLDFPTRPAFVCLGQFCPIAADSYRVSFDVALNPLPKDTWQHISIAFGHTDDRYYEHRSGDTDGYHALLRANGNLALYAHVEGDANGQEIAKPQSGQPLKPGLWSRLTLDVTPDLIRFSRDDGTSIEVKDDRFRGGYVHVGRSANEGMLMMRNLTVT